MILQEQSDQDAPLPEVQLISWRGIKKPTGLRGFATVEYHGLVLPEMPLMIQEDGPRVGLPRPSFNSGGRRRFLFDRFKDACIRPMDKPGDGHPQ
jgi:hypothetical protein